VRFGLIYELSVPHTGEHTEHQIYREALEQIQLADSLGFDHVWEVEHHFLEEYSHSSAPEVFLAAAAALTKNIRIGHGIVAMPAPYNHPARVAERIGALDLISNGRVDFGTGETTTEMELGGFNVAHELKQEMWEEAVEAVCRMMVEAPFRGMTGKYTDMPPRNIVPKPLQKPHPPIWVACSRRSTITRAAQRGMGSLNFSFLDPPEVKEWVDHYHEVMADEGSPIGYAVNPNLNVVTGFMCCKDEREAIDKGIDGAHFFYYSLSHYIKNPHRPAETNVWANFMAEREDVGLSRNIDPRGDDLSVKAKIRVGDTEAWGDRSTWTAEQLEARKQLTLETLRGAVGTPDQLRKFLRGFEEAGADEVIFVAQVGNNRHEDICNALKLFASEVMPEFKEREPGLRAAKAQRLAPVIAKVMSRKANVDLPPLDYTVLPSKNSVVPGMSTTSSPSREQPAASS
jgi:alkanesulfonate monooxygenase SsuD/methylene tetrahydromethanopterin reductase-like flavin-dependent oxidoreductase (luciferase family)